MSSLIGAALGGAAQYALPYALKDFLPVTAVVRLAPKGIGMGLAVGMGTALLFALIPLLPLRRIAPMMALRASIESDRPSRDRLAWLLSALIVLGIWAFAKETMASGRLGLWFTLAVLAVFGSLFLLARAGSALLRRVAPRVLSFPWRQGLANLYRPNNQTAAVTLAIGLGTFLLVTLYGAQNMLVKQVTLRGGQGEPNLVLFDVQKEQRRGIADLIKSHDVALRAEVPIVTMRLSAVKGRTVEEISADSKAKFPRWALRREYRSTYRSGLTGTEKIIEGTWQGSAVDGTDPIPVSLEKGIAENLQVGLGDRIPRRRARERAAVLCRRRPRRIQHGLSKAPTRRRRKVSQRLRDRPQLDSDHARFDSRESFGGDAFCRLVHSRHRSGSARERRHRQPRPAGERKYFVKNSGRAAPPDYQNHRRRIFVFGRHRRGRRRFAGSRRGIRSGLLLFRHSGVDFARSGGRHVVRDYGGDGCRRCHQQLGRFPALAA
jgi:hypothetical protein